MDPLGGLQSIERLRDAGNNNARIYVVDKAGHHGENFISILETRKLLELTRRIIVYLDNAEVVNNTLMKELYTDF